MQEKTNASPKITSPDRQNPLTSPLVITLLALICCALWGSATPFIKLGYELILPAKDVPSTILFAGIRFTAAGAITVVIYSIAARKILLPKRENLGRIGIVSIFQTVIQYIFFYIGLANTTGVKGTVASGSATFFAIIISSLIFRMERLTAKKVAACILGFAGIICVNLNGLTLDMNFFGDAFVIFSAISYALSSVLMKRFSKYESPVVISGYQFIAGGAFMIILGLSLGGNIAITSPAGLGVMVYLSFLSAIAYSLWGILLKYNPVSRISVFSFTTPIFGVILSALMLTESGGVEIANLLIALVLVAAGVILLNLNTAKGEKAAPDAAQALPDTAKSTAPDVDDGFQNNEPDGTQDAGEPTA